MFQRLVVVFVAAAAFTSSAAAQDLKKLDPFIGNWKGQVLMGEAPMGAVDFRWEWLLDKQFIQGRFQIDLGSQKIVFMNIFAIEDGKIRVHGFEPGKKCRVSEVSFQGETPVIEGPPDSYGVTRHEHQFSDDTLLIRALDRKDGFPVYQLKLQKVKKNDAG